MRIVAFTTECKDDINSKDLMVVRNLYQPKIGQLATSVYLLLVDHNTINGTTPDWNNFSDLANTLGVSINDVTNALKTLGAAGLIRKWENKDAVKVVIRINKPQKPSHLKDSLLSSIKSNKLSDLKYEKFQMFIENKVLVNKDEFQENTSRFQDVFELPKDSYQPNTLELPEVEPKSTQEAISGLSTPAFIKFLTGVACSPSQLESINILRQYGFSSHSMNLLFNYSFDVNGKIVIAYINKIAQDLLEKNILGPKAIRLELINALNSKNKVSIASEKAELYEPEETQEWEDIIEEIGEL